MTVASAAQARRAQRDVAVKAALDLVRARADLKARRANDPVELVHRQRSREDRELVALVAASCAFGNVKAIRSKLTELLDRVGPRPARAADDPEALAARLAGFKHRVFRGEDLAKLLIGARRVQRSAGSLGAAFQDQLRRVDREDPGAEPEARVREALASFCDRIRAEGGLPRAGEADPSGRRGPSHLLSDARAGSGAKRLLLFLRWMVRPADGIDLGLWEVPTQRLLVPVDVHIHKLARNLGLTRRRDLSWKTSVEITRALARFDASDPTRYDFSLCHMGMVQRCPSRPDDKRCEGCGVRPVCVHWTPRKEPRAKRVRSA
ncbi:MAG TPA: TIGR02757 family protein [Labilithrix sp.]|nr:TIGR02757 family protein [Labilithrix sp.]